MDDLGYDKSALGGIGSALLIGYAASKFIVSPMGDVMDSKSASLWCLCGVCVVSEFCLCMTVSAALTAVVTFIIARGIPGSCWLAVWLSAPPSTTRLPCRRRSPSLWVRTKGKVAVR